MSEDLPDLGPITVNAHLGEITVTVRDPEAWRRVMNGWPLLGFTADLLLEARYVAWPKQ